MSLRSCGDCGAAPGQLHVSGCDVERCPRCGHQAISCDCIYEVCGMDPATLEEKHPEIYHNGPTPKMEKTWNKEWGSRRMPWTGEWPGTAECREYGFWCLWGPEMRPPQKGWVPVPAGTPGAQENLNMLYEKCVWDPVKQRMVLREEAKVRAGVVSADKLNTKSLRASDYITNPREVAKTAVQQWANTHWVKFGKASTFMNSPAGKALVDTLEHVIRRVLVLKEEPVPSIGGVKMR